jgi:hypothetical protein
MVTAPDRAEQGEDAAACNYDHLIDEKWVLPTGIGLATRFQTSIATDRSKIVCP